jgi:hypothetical protein
VVRFERFGFRASATEGGGRVKGAELTILTARPGVGARWLP